MIVPPPPSRWINLASSVSRSRLMYEMLAVNVAATMAAARSFAMWSAPDCGNVDHRARRGAYCNDRAGKDCDYTLAS